MATLKAIRIEKTKEAFRFEINFGSGEEGECSSPVDRENSTAMINTTLSFMEAKACIDEDVTDGVELASELHDTRDESQMKNDSAVQVGKAFGKWGDELIKDPVKRDQLLDMVKPYVEDAIDVGGSLLKQALKVILCDKLGLVSEIRIERIASLLMLVWSLFKTAVITYSIVKGFEVLVKILRHVIQFLQETRFFEKLREMGGWETLCQLVVAYRPQLVMVPMTYLAVATVAAVTGGIAVYCYMKWRE